MIQSYIWKQQIFGVTNYKDEIYLLFPTALICNDGIFHGQLPCIFTQKWWNLFSNSDYRTLNLIKPKQKYHLYLTRDTERPSSLTCSEFPPTFSFQEHILTPNLFNEVVSSRYLIELSFLSYMFHILIRSWIKRDHLMSLALLSHYLMLNMFRTLIHPSSGACDLFVELFHGLYCSGTMCVGVTVWFGWGGVVWYPDVGCSSVPACIRIPHHPSQTTP